MIAFHGSYFLDRFLRRRPGAVFDDKLRQLGMPGETAAAAVTELRADLPNVTSGDFCAARRAIGVRARGAIVDENEAEHVGPPLELWREFIGASCRWRLV
jgi:hypothetical protein